MHEKIANRCTKVIHKRHRIEMRTGEIISASYYTVLYTHNTHTLVVKRVTCKKGHHEGGVCILLVVSGVCQG